MLSGAVRFRLRGCIGKVGAESACPAAMVIEFSVRVTLACSREDSAVALSVSKVVLIS